MTPWFRILLVSTLATAGCAHERPQLAATPPLASTTPVKDDDARYQQHLAYLQALSLARSNAVALEFANAGSKGATGIVLDGVHVLAPRSQLAGRESEVFVRTVSGAKIPARVLAWDDATGLVLLSAVVYSSVRPFTLNPKDASTGPLTLVGSSADGQVALSAARVANASETPTSPASQLQLIGELRPGACGAPAVTDDGSFAGLVLGGEPCSDGKGPMTLLPSRPVMEAIARMKSSIGH